MAGEYIVRPLPSNSIVEKQKKSRKGKTIPYFEVKFEGTSETFQIRPRAAFFAQRSRNPVYAVLYSASNKTECLFLFSSMPSNSGEVQYICRCSGSRKVKEHWLSVALLLAAPH